MKNGFILQICVFGLFAQTLSLPMQLEVIVKTMKKDQQNFGKEMANRKKHHSPFFFKSLKFQDSSFEKLEQEKKEKQREISVQLRKNAIFNNGLRWMSYQRREQRLSKMVTNSTRKDFNESNQSGLKELCLRAVS